MTQTKRPHPGHFQLPPQKQWLGANTTGVAIEQFRASGTEAPFGAMGLAGARLHEGAVLRAPLGSTFYN